MEMLIHEDAELLSGRRIRAARAAIDRRRSSTAAFYEDHAEEYAAATIGIDVSERIAKFVQLLPEGASVLDAGCGAGRDLVSLGAAGLQPFGLDSSARLAAAARLTSGRSVRVGDLRCPPYPPASFDGVWAMASLLHLERDETTPALIALAELLVPGGMMFASVKRGAGQTRDDDGRWFTLYDERGWERHLLEAGLEVVEILGEPPAGTGSVRPGWISSLARRPS